MSEFNIRSESVDVEQIMTQIRGRLAEKRGVDYTEEQIRELASVRLEKFLDPKHLRSDLLEQFRRSRPAVAVDPAAFEPPYTFDDTTLFASHRALMRRIRQLLLPVLKLFFNPNPLIKALHTQVQFNVDMLKRDATRRLERSEWNVLYYEVLHNLVLETTRTGIEVKNLRMRVESLSSRLDFSERRVRALEGVVQYRPEVQRTRERRDTRPEAAGGPADLPGTEAGASGESADAAGRLDGDGRRRRRRRRGRRGNREGFGGAPGQETDASGADTLPDADGDSYDDEGPDTDGSSSTPDAQ